MNYRLSDDGKTLTHVDLHITSFEIPNSITNIEWSAFQFHFNLKSVTIPGNIRRINSFTFIGCTALETINIPNVSEIGDIAFYNCNNLTILNIANTTKIGIGALSQCYNLVDINSKLSPTQIKSAFDDKKQYNAYLKRNRDYKLKHLIYEI